MGAQDSDSPFLRIPPEIRLMIYNLLLVDGTKVVRGVQNLMCTPDYYEYEKNKVDQAFSVDNVLSFRNIGPPQFSLESHEGKRRTSYKVRAGRFRARCVDVTYGCVNLPDIHTNVLSVSRHIHNEAAAVLYSSYTFDFDSNIEACVPFLKDLTPFSRSCVRKLGVIKRALPYDKDFDRCEWFTMCSYLSQNAYLSTFLLGIVSGKPVFGWDDVPVMPFDGIVQRYKRDEMQWVRDLMMIKGLHSLQVRPCIEHCPPPGSDAMQFFVEFSANVESGTFSSYLTSRMIAQEA